MGVNSLIFLLNIVLNIKKMAAKYCCCKNLEICLVCQAKHFYCDYEFKIYKNCLDLDFLAKQQSNVYRNLLKLLTLDNHFVC